MSNHQKQTLQMEDKESILNFIPKDCLLTIFSFLHNIHDVIKNVTRVCKLWNNLILNEKHNLFHTIIIDNTRTDIPLVLQKKVTEGQLLYLIQCCRNNTVRRWVLRDHRNSTNNIEFTVSVFYDMECYNMFYRLEQLTFPESGSKSLLFRLMNDAACQSSGVLKDLEISLELYTSGDYGGYVIDINSFLNKNWYNFERFSYNGYFHNVASDLILPKLTYLHVDEPSYLDSILPYCPNLTEISWNYYYMVVPITIIDLIEKYCPKVIKIGALSDKVASVAAAKLPQLQFLTVDNEYDPYTIGMNCRNLISFIDKNDSNYYYETDMSLLGNIGSGLKHLYAPIPLHSKDFIDKCVKLCPHLESIGVLQSFSDDDDDEEESGTSNIMQVFTSFSKLQSVYYQTENYSGGIPDTSEKEGIATTIEQEIGYRRNIIADLIQTTQLQHEEYIDQQEEIIELDLTCLYRIRNIHPDWIFDIKIISFIGNCLKVQFIKRIK
jgi:hypothetical protein